MAEGFAKKMAGDRFDIFSAGTKPAGFVHPDAIAVMKELGIDISSQYSKGFNQVPAKKFDYLVTMGCEKTCPVVPTEEKLDWQIEDPIGQPIEVFCRIRDDIKARIEGLFLKI
jgi:arsenate reductase